MSQELEGEDVTEEMTPQQWAARWELELKGAHKEVEKWHKQGKKVIKRFRDERDTQGGGKDLTRLNVFTSNVQMQQGMLLGRVPTADVSRRFADSSDDLARVGGEIMERLLNTDVEHGSAHS